MLDGEDKRTVVKTILGFVPEPFLELERIEAQRVLSFRHIVNDLDTAASSLEKLLMLQKAFSELDNIIVAALWRQCLACYARCFTKSDDGFSSLEETNVIDSGHSAMHRTLMSLRHTTLAHRGVNEIEDGFVLVLPIRENGHVVLKLEPIEVLRQGHFIEEVQMVINHIRDLHLSVQQLAAKRVEGITKKLSKELGFPRPFD